MRILFNVLFLIGLNCVLAKNNVKPLTESMGQEVIEIGALEKDLPADLEEEPSAELENEKTLTSTTLAAATKKDTKKPTAVVPERRKNNSNKIEDDSKQEDEEMRIEKELAEIYKDNLDYKADSSESTVKVTLSGVAEEGKPVARARATNFKFQPDINNKAEVERFRTSIDEISCAKQAVVLQGPESKPDTDDTKPNGAVTLESSAVIYLLILTTSFLRF